jgi:hypothetical protein
MTFTNDFVSDRSCNDVQKSHFTHKPQLMATVQTVSLAAVALKLQLANLDANTFLAASANLE